jgi:GNAT superfamily N-acetyltransferase
VDDRVPTAFGPLAVRRATREDAQEILRLRDELSSWMAERGIDQWRRGEMPLAWLEECAAQGWLLAACLGDDIVASVTVAWADPFVWGDQAERAGYIHMLMVDRAYAGHRLGRSLLDWAERRIARSGTHLARLDCVRANLDLRAYYENAGYRLVGYADFARTANAILGGSVPAETALYEKTLTE